MRKKRIFAALSALMLCINTAFAADVSAAEKPVCIYLNGSCAGENDIASVSVMFDKETEVSAFTIEVVYNPEQLEFVDASMGKCLEGGTFYDSGNTFEDSVRLVWSDSRDHNAEGTVATLKFKTKSETEDSTAPLYVGYCQLGTQDFEEIEYRSEDFELEILKKYKRGDVNGDGEISGSDVVKVNKYIISGNKFELDENQLRNADVNLDGIVNSKDCMIIIGCVLGTDGGNL